MGLAPALPTAALVHPRAPTVSSPLSYKLRFHQSVILNVEANRRFCYSKLSPLGDFFTGPSLCYIRPAGLAEYGWHPDHRGLRLDCFVRLGELAMTAMERHCEQSEAISLAHDYHSG